MYKIVSTPNLQLKTIFFNYEDVRRDLELCHSLGIVNVVDVDILTYLLKKANIPLMKDIISRGDFGRKLVKYVESNSHYGFIDPISKKEFMFLINKVWLMGY